MMQMNGKFILNNKYLRILFKNKLFIIAITAYFLSALTTCSHFLYNWDAGQFALGTKLYSLALHQPHPPGYYLFVKTGKLVNLLINDINSAFILLNIAAGALTIYFVFRLVKKISGHRDLAFWLCLLLMANPVFWFYHEVALSYTFEALTTAMLAYYSYLVIKDHDQSKIRICALSTALIMGFRPSVLIIAIPFFLIQFVYTKNKVAFLFKTLLFGFVGMLIWGPFFVVEVGGISELVVFIKEQLSIAQQTNVYNIDHHLFLFYSLLYALHLPIVLSLIFLKQIIAFVKQKHLWFIVAVIIWQVIVYLFLHFGEVGYINGLIPLSYLICMPIIEKILRSRWSWILPVLVVLQCLIFIFGLPGANHHKIQQINWLDIKNHDYRIATYLQKVRQYNPDELLLVVLRGQYVDPNGDVRSYPYDDIRILSYYLPQYKIYDLLGVEGVYFVAVNYDYQKVDGNIVKFSDKNKTALFLADYIAPEMRPKNLQLYNKFSNPEPSNYYLVDNMENFEYNGMIFVKTSR